MQTTRPLAVEIFQVAIKLIAQCTCNEVKDGKAGNLVVEFQPSLIDRSVVHTSSCCRDSSRTRGVGRNDVGKTREVPPLFVFLQH